jgi:hypothetical protein
LLGRSPVYDEKKCYEEMVFHLFVAMRHCEERSSPDN